MYNKRLLNDSSIKVRNYAPYPYFIALYYNLNKSSVYNGWMYVK